MGFMALEAYAKINLGLHILEKRTDGYHNILTVFQQIDLHDTLSFRKTPSEINIVSSLSTLPSDESNLVYQAFTVFKNAASISGGIEVHLEKRIPMGGGLGGGSSDAAATLKALNHLWGNRLTHKELFRLAGEIGSDVPFFLMGGTALGSGRGEILEPISLENNYWIVLLLPNVSVSTAWAYRQAKIPLTKDEKCVTFRSLFEKGTLQSFRTDLINEFEEVVFERHPQLRSLKSRLYKEGAFYASMSGSGSTIYGLFYEEKEARAALAFFSSMDDVTACLSRPISS